MCKDESKYDFATTCPICGMAVLADQVKSECPHEPIDSEEEDSDRFPF